MECKKSSENLHEKDVRWKQTADDARKQLAALKTRSSKLRGAIRFCEDSFASGEPWPEPKSDNAATQN